MDQRVVNEDCSTMTEDTKLDSILHKSHKEGELELSRDYYRTLREIRPLIKFLEMGPLRIRKGEIKVTFTGPFQPKMSPL